MLTAALTRTGRMAHQVPNETHQWGLRIASTSPRSQAGFWVDLAGVLPPYPRGQPHHPVPQGLAKDVPSSGSPYLLPCLGKSYPPSSLSMAPCSRKPALTAQVEGVVLSSPCHEAWSCGRVRPSCGNLASPPMSQLTNSETVGKSLGLPGPVSLSIN